MRLRPLLLLLALGLVGAPLIPRFAGPLIYGSKAANPGQTGAPKPTTTLAVTVETVAKGLEHPWGLQVLPDGRLLVTERPGRLRIVSATGELSPPISGLPPVEVNGQGGLLDVALDPKFGDNSLIYWTYAEPRSSGKSGTTVARGKLTIGGAPTTSGPTARVDDVRVIFRQDDATPSLHFGSRLVFARDGTLFIALGERNLKTPAQDMSSTLGKVVRINADGSLPSDNPFVGPTAGKTGGKNGTTPEIWSSGHRNIQGGDK